MSGGYVQGNVYSIIIIINIMMVIMVIILSLMSFVDVPAMVHDVRSALTSDVHILQPMNDS